MRWRWVLATLLASVMIGATQAGATDPPRWSPSSADRFQIILANPPKLGQLHGAFDVIESDGFETPVTTVTSVHSLLKRAVCYIDVGTWEQWRPDHKRFPASVLGKPDDGWPGERWLDIRQTAVLLPIMRARFAMCKHKGFDAVDPDNVNGVENKTGFAITVAQQDTYDNAIAAIAHTDGMAVALKSYAGGAAAIGSSFDFVVDEQCVKYMECSAFAPFVAHGQPVFDIEYVKTLTFCGALPPGVFGIAKHLSLDAWRRACP